MMTSGKKRSCANRRALIEGMAMREMTALVVGQDKFIRAVHLYIAFAVLRAKRQPMHTLPAFQCCYDLACKCTHKTPTNIAGVQFDGYICRVQANAVGAWVLLGTTEDCTAGLRAMTNPHVWRSMATAEMMQTLSFTIFRPNVILMTSPVDPCNLGTVVRSDVEGEARFYMLEPRLNLVENTLEKPASAGSWLGGVCPAVSRTFVNRQSCKLLPGCLPLGVESIQLTLNAEAFQRFFTVGQRYVYAITGLRTSTSPCNRKSRWKRLDCNVDSCATSSLPTSDMEAIQAQLTAEAAQGWLRDATIECNSITAGALVQVGSEYFQHVHLDEFSVYDFTDWAAAHPGGRDKITQWTNQALWQQLDVRSG